MLGQPLTHGTDPSTMQHAPVLFLVLESTHLSSALNFYFDFPALVGEQWIFIKTPQQHTHHKHNFPQSFKTLPTSPHNQEAENFPDEVAAGTVTFLNG